MITKDYEEKLVSLAADLEPKIREMLEKERPAKENSILLDALYMTGFISALNEFSQKNNFDKK
jgi:hypothetical protein